MHTRGPWKYSIEEYGFRYILSPEPHNGVLAKIIASVKDADANGHLIAAAPDLLDAAKKAINFVSNSLAWNELKAAIAKAEGAL